MGSVKDSELVFTRFVWRVSVCVCGGDDSGCIGVKRGRVGEI